MTIPWDQLFELLFQLLEGCGDTAEKRVDAINNKPVARYIEVTRALRKLGFGGRQLRAARQEVIEEISDASSEEIKAFAEGGGPAYLAVKV